MANGFVKDMDEVQQGVEANHDQNNRVAAWTQNIARKEGKLATRSVSFAGTLTNHRRCWAAAGADSIGGA